MRRRVDSQRGIRVALTMLVVMCVLMALLVAAVRATQGPRNLDEVDLKATTSAEIQAASISLTIHPRRPTSADVVQVQVGAGGKDLQQALRAGVASFYAVESQLPVQRTYVLAALAPGYYSFSLFRVMPAVPSCNHQQVGKTTFTVAGAGVQTGSGELVLTARVSDRDAAQRLVENENPQFSWSFGSWGELRVVPGLEQAYADLLRTHPDVTALDLNSVGFTPECPPPLGSALRPGSLLVKFRDGVSRAQAEELLQRLPPELASFQPAWLLSQASLRVRVPVGWEALFLNRYRGYRQTVVGGSVAPLPKGK